MRGRDRALAAAALVVGALSTIGLVDMPRAADGRSTFGPAASASSTTATLRCTGTAAPAPTGPASTIAVPAGPEIATGFASKAVAYGATVMAVTANPVASRVACDVLARGGDAIDAAIAAQMALNLVEPQSSGLGGGAFLLYYDAATRAVESYDGRETAPAAATENYLRWVDDASDRTTPRPNARASGRSIGTPGVLRMLEFAHRDHGRLPWASLFDAGIALATTGSASGRG